MSILRQKSKFATYKPMRYEWAYRAYEEQSALHWRAKEVPVGEDIVDYNKLADKEKEFIRNILRLFTQNDVEAMTGYIRLLDIVKPTEIRMWLSTALSVEAIHVDAYALLTDSLGFDETFYNEFFDIPVMERKINYLEKAKVKTWRDYKALGLSDIEIDKRFRADVLRMVAVYAAGLEGIELMAQFMLLLAYSELGLFKGMTQINTYSIKDEFLHQKYNTMLFLELVEENADVYTDEVRNDIINAIRQIVEQEFALLDYLYAHGEHPTISIETAKHYVAFMGNRALKMLGLPLQWETTKNPVNFMEELLSSVELANFFETEVTGYTKNIRLGEWSDVRKNGVKLNKMMLQSK